MANAIAEALKGDKLTCVQCKQSYTVSLNGEGHCTFHSEPYDDWNRKYKCCGNGRGAAGCQRTKHQPEHHCNYPYETFFTRVWGIMNYTDTHEEFGAEEDEDLEGNGKEKAWIGQIYREASRASLLAVEKQGILVSVGTVWAGSKYHWKVYTKPELDQIALHGTAAIFKTSDGPAFSAAEWIIKDDHVIGARLIAKAATSLNPSVSEVFFSTNPIAKGEVKKISAGGISETAPTAEYVVPEEARTGPVLVAAEPRAAKTDFKTIGDMPIAIKLLSGEKWKANDRSTPNGDIFEGALSFINTGVEELTIVDVKVEWKLFGDKDWKPIDEVKVMPDAASGAVPFACLSKKPVTVHFNLFVADAEKKKLWIQWYNRSWIGKIRPIRLRVSAEDLLGRKASYTVEHVNKKLDLTVKEDDQLFFTFVDDLTRWERHTASVKKGDGETVVSISGYNTGLDLTLNTLRKYVFQARKSGETEISLGIEKQEETRGWNVTALVDLNNNRVYALKFILNSPTSSTVAYFKLPLYGNSTAGQPPAYAKDTSQVPQIAPWKGEEPGPDVDPDDLVVAQAAPPPVAGGAAAGGVAAVPPEVLARIASLEDQLKQANQGIQHMAQTLDKLLQVMSERKH